jgi:hypothetical protein
MSGFGCVVMGGNNFYTFGGSNMTGGLKNMWEYKVVKGNSNKGLEFDVKKMPNMINTRD